MGCTWCGYRLRCSPGTDLRLSRRSARQEQARLARSLGFRWLMMLSWQSSGRPAKPALHHQPGLALPLGSFGIRGRAEAEGCRRVCDAQELYSGFWRA